MKEEYLAIQANDITGNFELIESLKIAYYIIDNINIDIKYNLETKEEQKTTQQLENINNKLYEIIKKYDKKESKEV